MNTYAVTLVDSPYAYAWIESADSPADAIAAAKARLAGPDKDLARLYRWQAHKTETVRDPGDWRLAEAVTISGRYRAYSPALDAYAYLPVRLDSRRNAHMEARTPIELDDGRWAV